MEKRLAIITRKETKSWAESKRGMDKLRKYLLDYRNNLISVLGWYHFYDFGSLNELKEYVRENKFKAGDRIYLGDVKIRKVEESGEYYRYEVTLADIAHSTTLKAIVHGRSNDRYVKGLIALESNTDAEVWLWPYYEGSTPTKMFKLVSYWTNDDRFPERERHSDRPPISDTTIDDILKPATTTL